MIRNYRIKSRRGNAPGVGFRNAPPDDQQRAGDTILRQVSGRLNNSLVTRFRKDNPPVENSGAAPDILDERVQADQGGPANLALSASATFG